MTTPAPESSPPAEATNGAIVATAGTWFRNTRYVMVIVLFCYGGWSIYDGFVSWPHWQDSHPNEMPKTQMDILFNRVIGVSLPPLSVAYLIYILHKSRGEYRLENGVVYIPGHPPVPLGKISMVNRLLWDRKGIAMVDYNLTNSDGSVPPGLMLPPRGTFRLDDFVYDREPTDQIFKEIELALSRATSARAAAAPQQPKTRLPPRPRIGPGL